MNFPRNSTGNWFRAGPSSIFVRISTSRCWVEVARQEGSLWGRLWGVFMTWWRHSRRWPGIWQRCLGRPTKDGSEGPSKSCWSFPSWITENFLCQTQTPPPHPGEQRRLNASITRVSKSLSIRKYALVFLKT